MKRKEKEKQCKKNMVQRHGYEVPITEKEYSQPKTAPLNILKELPISI